MLCIPWMVNVLNRSLGFTYQFFITPRKGETYKQEAASAPDELEFKEIKYSEVRDETRIESNYPLFPLKEASTFILELKG